MYAQQLHTGRYTFSFLVGMYVHTHSHLRCLKVSGTHILKLWTWIWWISFAAEKDFLKVLKFACWSAGPFAIDVSQEVLACTKCSEVSLRPNQELRWKQQSSPSFWVFILQWFRVVSTWHHTANPISWWSDQLVTVFFAQLHHLASCLVIDYWQRWPSSDCVLFMTRSPCLWKGVMGCSVPVRLCAHVSNVLSSRTRFWP